LLTVGERRLNMMRAFNAREGIGREADKLPDKLFDRPLEGGPTDGWRLDRENYAEAIEEYYRQVGWDPETGNPTPGKLQALGLDWITV
jgi:aldehyde:ferredoxin oxidoreductase